LACSGAETFETTIVHNAAPRVAHVSSAVVLRDGRLRAVWYEGERELAPDVSIMTATYAQGRWSAPRTVIDPREASRALGRYVRKLGNAVIYRDSRGELVLIFASVSFGGWSAASPNLMRSSDDGETWSAPVPLVTSPLFNFSTLVRSPPLLMTNGSVLIPAYDELHHTYPEVLVLTDDGRVAGRRRIGARRFALQPAIVPFNDRVARAYMRAQRTLFAFTSDTADAGATWSDLVQIAIPSVDNPLAIERVAGDHMLAIFNDRGREGAAVGPLSVALSADRGKSWRVIHAIEHARGDSRYPWLMAGADRHYHLFYTQSLEPGSEIVHVRFSRDWLAAHGGPPCP
jgi:predicted neuraminidase